MVKIEILMWTKEEIDKLVELHPNLTNVEIGNILNKNKVSVDNKAYNLQLKKSKKHLTKISHNANLIRIENGGRNLTYDYLKNIALKYKTRIEFNLGDNSAYNSARLKGVLNDICSHMTVMKFSIPQLILKDILDKIIGCESHYNDRTVIKPYEIDIYYQKYKLAFEYQGRYWHGDNFKYNNDLTKYNLLINNGINIIYINEKTRDYENEIKKQLINQLVDINKNLPFLITENDIMGVVVGDIYSELYNKDELIAVAKGYDCFKVFKKAELTIYRKLLKLKLIDVATQHMGNKRRFINLNENEIKDIVSGYNNLTDFRKNELTLYKHIKRTSKDYLIKHLKSKQQFILKEITLTIKKYKLKCDFISNNKKMYKYIRRNKLINLLASLIDCRSI